MKFKSAAIGLALIASAISAQATSSLSLDASSLSITGGFFRPVGLAGSLTASVQDQIGWTAGGAAEWGPVDTLTKPWSAASVSLTSPNGAFAQVVTPGHLTVSTPEQGGFAQAEQDFTLQLFLAAHSTITVSWSVTLSGSNSGLSSGTFAALGTVTLGDVVQTYPFSQDFAGTENSASSFTGSPLARSITFTNTSDSNIVTAYHSNIKISTLDVIPAPAAAVPEADAAWMALAGMAVVGALIRRRR